MKNWTQIENRLRREGVNPAPSTDHTARIMGAIRDVRAQGMLDPADSSPRYGWLFAAAAALAVVMMAAVSMYPRAAQPSPYDFSAIGPAALLSVDHATHAPLTREAGRIRGDLASATDFLFDLLPSVEPGG